MKTTGYREIFIDEYELNSEINVSSEVVYEYTQDKQNCIRRIFPNKMQNGKLTLLNEEEVACIKEIQ